MCRSCLRDADRAVGEGFKCCGPDGRVETVVIAEVDIVSTQGAVVFEDYFVLG